MFYEKQIIINLFGSFVAMLRIIIHRQHPQENPPQIKIDLTFIAIRHKHKNKYQRPILSGLKFPQIWI